MCELSICFVSVYVCTPFSIPQVRQGECRVEELQVALEQAAQEQHTCRLQKERELQEWREGFRTASEALRLMEADLEEARCGRDAALRNLRLLEEQTHSHSLHTHSLQGNLQQLQAQVNCVFFCLGRWGLFVCRDIPFQLLGQSIL